MARLLKNFHWICCTKGAEWFDRVIQFPAGVFSHHCSNNNLSSFLCQTTVLKSVLVKLSLEFLHDTHGNQQLKGNIYRYLNGISAHYIQSPIYRAPLLVLSPSMRDRITWFNTHITCVSFFSSNHTNSRLISRRENKRIHETSST